MVYETPFMLLSYALQIVGVASARTHKDLDHENPAVVANMI